MSLGPKKKKKVPYEAPTHKGAGLWGAPSESKWRCKVPMPEDMDYDEDLDDFLSDEFPFPTPTEPSRPPARQEPKGAKEDGFRFRFDEAKKKTTKKPVGGATTTTTTKKPLSSKEEEKKERLPLKEARERASLERVDRKWQKEKGPQMCMAWHCSKKRVFRCSACQQRWYCSRSCQKTDWTHVHKVMCPELQKRKQDAEAKKKEPEVIKIRLRQRAKGEALERQTRAIEELTFSESVDYVVFAENSKVQTSKISFPNMGGKVQCRLLRLKAAQGHLCYLRKLHKMLIDHSPHLTMRIRTQLRAEYDIDPMSPIVQQDDDDLPHKFPTDYEVNRVFAALNCGTLEEQLIRSGAEERIAQAKRDYGDMSFEEYVEKYVEGGHDPYDPAQWEGAPEPSPALQPPGATRYTGVPPRPRKEEDTTQHIKDDDAVLDLDLQEEIEGHEERKHHDDGPGGTPLTADDFDLVLASPDLAEQCGVETSFPPGD